MSKLRLWHRLARLAAALGVAAACWACNAPFIPIPPPGQTATFTSALVSDGAGGQKTVWVAHGPPDKDAAFARFFVFDRELKAGVITTAAADGSFNSPPMDGTENDHVDINFETPAGGVSVPVCFVLTTNTVLVPPPNGTTPSAPQCQ
jgi:hypothetical protein